MFFPQALLQCSLQVHSGNASATSTLKINFRSLYKLARVCQKLTPLAGIDSDLVQAFRQRTLNENHFLYHGLVLDITGTERIHRGEENLCSKIIRAFEKKNIPCRLAIAPTIGAAWALSRFSPNQTSIVRTASLREALGDLSVASLRIHPQTVTALEELGITKVSQLLKFPTKTLGSRFGLDPLRRVHQALGTVEEGFFAIPPASPFRVMREFDIPLTNHLSTQAITLELFSKLCANLRQRARKARSFVILFSGKKNTVAKEITLNTSTHTMKHFQSVLTPVIERLSLREGIIKISITARSVEKFIPHQKNFITAANDSAAEAAKETINSMMVRLGHQRICESIIHESYVPEDSFSYAPIQPNHVERTTRSKALPPKQLPLALQLLDRPPYLFSKPEKASVLALLPDHPPARITWRGTEYKVLTGIGPERIAPEWWKKDFKAGERDYFKLQDDMGRWLWVYRNQQTHEWWVHGLWA